MKTNPSSMKISAKMRRQINDVHGIMRTFTKHHLIYKEKRVGFYRIKLYWLSESLAKSVFTRLKRKGYDVEIVKSTARGLLINNCVVKLKYI